MKNRQLLPFERNRYYAGKALTSTDFYAEQLYMNNKRRFMNNVMFGSGIVCGLNVLNLDDMTIMIESGAAIDETGREIVIESSIVKKITTLEGYDKINGGDAYLCIRYKEKEIHPVYRASKNTQGEDSSEYECNRIEEGYDLFLVSAAADGKGFFEMDDEFLYEKVLMDNEDYLVKLRIPAAVSKGKAAKLVFDIKKKSASPEKLTLRADFQMPVFTSMEGTHNLEVRLNDIDMEEGEQICHNYWFNVEQTDLDESSLLARREDVRIYQGNRAVEVSEDISLNLLLVNLSPDELATREIGKMNLEMRNIHQMNDLIKLAKLSFSNTGSMYVVKTIREQGIKKYIATPRETYHRNKYLSYFKESERKRNGTVSGVSLQKDTSQPVGPGVKMASGRIEIPLPMNMKKGEVCFSDEIMHGLGKGNVYVKAGLSLENGDTIYGDTGLFEQPELIDISTAVKVFKEKGTFQVAVRLNGNQSSIIAILDWFAIRIEAQNNEPAARRTEQARLVPRNSTVQLKTGDKYFFEVNFEHMQECQLSYELTEPNSGEIGNDGVYCAPMREGVFEIKIYCTGNPNIATYVYAIVGGR